MNSTLNMLKEISSIEDEKSQSNEALERRLNSLKEYIINVGLAAQNQGFFVAGRIEEKNQPNLAISEPSLSCCTKAKRTLSKLWDPCRGPCAKAMRTLRELWEPVEPYVRPIYRFLKIPFTIVNGIVALWAFIAYIMRSNLGKAFIKIHKFLKCIIAIA